MAALPPLGAHVSVAGGMLNAIERATALGCTAAQVFVKNANQWRGRELGDEEAAAFRAAHAGSARRAAGGPRELPDQPLRHRSG